jgi:hypothetical protein
MVEMDHREQEPPPLGPGGAGWQALGAARERAVFGLQRRLVWPLQDRSEALGLRGRIGLFGGGGVAVAAVVAALVFGLPGGSGSSDAPAPVAAVEQPSTPKVAGAPAPQPKNTAPTKASGPTLHGAPPDFAPAQNVKAGVGNNEALGRSKRDSKPGGVPAERGAAGTGADGANGEAPSATAGGDPAATAKIGATPAATAAAQADELATGGRGDGVTSDGTTTDATADGNSGTGAAVGTGDETAGVDSGFTGPPAPKAAKQTARRFAQAFVVYEVGGVDGNVRRAFGQTGTKQLSKSLLGRPPRQPANVKVPKAKVVNVVAGPSKGSVYTVSVSLLRVGVTSELRLQLEQGPGKKWQVTNVLG